MNKILCILFLLNSFLNFSQTVKSDKFMVEIKTQLSDSVAYDFSAFLENEVSEIKLISIRPEEIYSKDWKDSITGEYFLESLGQTTIISATQDSIDQSRFKTIINLKIEDVSTLLATIYSPEQSNSYTNCYDPRHGVVFYNDEQVVIGFLEICFHCSHIRVFGEVPNPGLKPDEVYYQLEVIFKKYMNDYFDEKKY